MGTEKDAAEWLGNAAAPVFKTVYTLGLTPPTSHGERRVMRSRSQGIEGNSEGMISAASGWAQVEYIYSKNNVLCVCEGGGFGMGAFGLTRQNM